MVDSADTSAKSTPLDAILNEIRDVASGPKDVGDRYERLCKGALSELRTPNGAKRFDRVWLWDDWPGRDGPDRGIDLVAEWSAAEGGGFAAVQCKCHAERSSIATRELDSFLTESSKRSYRNRVLIHTKTSLPISCRNRLRGQEKRCIVWNIEEQRSWHLNWWAIAENNGVVPRRRSADSSGTSDGAAQGAVEHLKRLMSRGPKGDGLLIALVALGALSFLAGASFGWLLILCGLIGLGLRRGSRAQTPGQRRSRSPSPRHCRPRPRHEPYDLEDLEDDWDDFEPPRRGSRNRRRRSGGWETDDADYI